MTLRILRNFDVNFDDGLEEYEDDEMISSGEEEGEEDDDEMEYDEEY